MAIDKIFFSVMPVRKSDFAATSSDILASYRTSEQQYERTHFGHVVLSSLDVCKNAALRHESWELQTLDVKAPAQVYAVFKVGDDVMLISSAFTNTKDRKAMLGKFSALCKSFKPGGRK